MEGLELIPKKRRSRLPEKERKLDKESGGFESEKSKRKPGARKEFVLKGKIADENSEAKLEELQKELELEALKRRVEGVLHQKMHNEKQSNLWIQFSKNSNGELIMYAGDGEESAHVDGEIVNWSDPENIEKTLIDFPISENAVEKQARKILREISDLEKISRQKIDEVFNNGLHKKFLDLMENKKFVKKHLSEINIKLDLLSDEGKFLLAVKDEYGEYEKEAEAANGSLKYVIERRRDMLRDVLEKYNQQIEKTATKKSNVAAKKPATIKQKRLDELEGRSRIGAANNGSANDEIEEFAQGVIENKKRNDISKKENDEDIVNIPISSESKSEDVEVKTSKQEDGGGKIEIETEKTEEMAEKKDLQKEEQLDLFAVGAENKEKLEQLRKEVEDARKEYAETDYEKNNAYKRIYKLLFNWSEDKNRIEDQDIAYYRAHYDKKLFNYKNALIEDAKARAASNEELGEIVRLFELEGRLNMADAHTQVKFENQDGKLLGFVKNHGKEMVAWYNGLSLKKKIAIGAAFGLATASSVFAGAAIAGTVASAATMRRVFAGVVTGTTLSLALESRDRKKTEKNIEKKVKSFIEQLNELPAEERARIVEDKIKELVFRGDDELQKIKNKNLFHLSAGALVGTVIGSGALSDVIGKGWHKVAGYFGDGSEISVGGGAGKTIEMAKSHGGGYLDSSAVESDSSVVSPKIQSVAPLESEDVIAPKPNGIDSSGLAAGESQFPRSLSPEELQGAGDAIESVRESGVNDAIEFIEKVGRAEMAGKLDEILASIDSQNREVFGKWSVAADAADAHELLVQKHDLDFMKGFLENFKDSVLSGNEESSARSIQKIISTGNDWQEIKDMRFTGETVKELGWRSNERVVETLENLNKIFGKEIKPGAQETLESWTKRVAAIAVEKSGK